MRGGINTYEYALNNPILVYDPFGLEPNPTCVAACTIGGGVIGGAAGYVGGGIVGGAIGGFVGSALGPGGTVAGGATGASEGSTAGGTAGAAGGATVGNAVGQALCPEEDDKECSKASKWQLRQAGIVDEHSYKTEWGAVPNSRFDICACRDGSIIIKTVGQCGKPGPSIPTTERWK